MNVYESIRDRAAQHDHDKARSYLEIGLPDNGYAILFVAEPFTDAAKARLIEFVQLMATTKTEAVDEYKAGELGGASDPLVATRRHTTSGESRVQDLNPQQPKE